MKADLHVHSRHSPDGQQTVQDILERCQELGIGAVAITDHNSLQGGIDALALKKKGIIVLTGVEVSTADGHVLAYHVYEPIPRNKSVEETIDVIHGLGGLAVAPHPYRIWSGLGERKVRDAKFDAVEVLNARSLEIGNRKAVKLASEIDRPVTGGSDGHCRKDIGKAYTVFPDDCTDADEMVRAITNKMTKVEGESRRTIASLEYGSGTNSPDGSNAVLKGSSSVPNEVPSESWGNEIP